MKSCSTCPFRINARMAYDQDALEALAEGCIPSCHQVVGKNAIFFEFIPDDTTRCRGHELWIAGDPGHCEPAKL